MLLVQQCLIVESCQDSPKKVTIKAAKPVKSWVTVVDGVHRTYKPIAGSQADDERFYLFLENKAPESIGATFANGREFIYKFYQNPDSAFCAGIELIQQ